MVSPLNIPPRREIKYFLRPEQAPILRSGLTHYCHLDPHAEASTDGRYAVTSLYFDSASLAFHRATVERAHDRLKLRIRTYGTGAPIFAEVKHKAGDVVTKTREPLGERWRHELQSAGEFGAAMQRFSAAPAMLVRYRREAWIGIEEAYARVTLDDLVEFQPCDQLTLDGGSSWRRSDLSATVLEMKYETEMPLWMRDLVARLQLVRTGFSKYSSAQRQRGDLLLVG